MEKITFYTKLLVKLEKIKEGEMTLEGYIEEVKSKLHFQEELHREITCVCDGDPLSFTRGTNAIVCKRCGKIKQ